MSHEEQPPEATQPSDKGCPVCGKPGFLGFADNPSTRYCADHAPGLSPEERAIYRQAAGSRS